MEGKGREREQGRMNGGGGKNSGQRKGVTKRGEEKMVGEKEGELYLYFTISQCKVNRPSAEVKIQLFYSQTPLTHSLQCYVTLNN